MIHQTALISPDAELAPDVEVGPYCIIGPNVTLGSGSRLHAHVVVEKETSIGKHCEFFPFSSIGGRTQDLKYNGEPTRLEIGDRNTFRENTTIHRSTSHSSPTRIGNNNHFLAYSHVAHDCTIGNHVIFSNNATVGGHVIVEDYAILGGFAGVHQFCRIGQHSLVGGCAKVTQDLTPYMIADGYPAAIRGINKIGLQRKNFPDSKIREVKSAYKAIFFHKKRNLSESLSALESITEITATIKTFIQESERGIMR